jgi:uroporphyrinogen-III synthase
MGHQAMLAPLLQPVFSDGPEPELADVQAILATSANGIRALMRRTARRDIPVFAVGPQTAEEATNAGFADVRSADGDALALAEAASRWARPDGILLHVCGADAPGTLADRLRARGFIVRRAELYGMDPAAALPAQVRAALAEGGLDAVMFFSPRTARLFVELAEGLPTGRLTALCISPNAAKVLPPDRFAGIAVAKQPNQDAMLALVCGI